MWLGGKSVANKADDTGCGAAPIEADSIGETFTLDGFEDYDAVVSVAGIVGGSEIEVVALECSFHRN